MMQTTPERNVVVAVMLRAILDYKKGNDIEKKDAELWLRSNRGSAISFRFACAVLGLDPGKIRRVLCLQNDKAH